MSALIRLPEIITVKPVSGSPPDAKASGAIFLKFLSPGGACGAKTRVLKCKQPKKTMEYFLSVSAHWAAFSKRNTKLNKYNNTTTPFFLLHFSQRR